MVKTVKFTAHQLKLVQDQSFLKEKRIITANISTQLYKVGQELKSILPAFENQLPEGCLTISGKVSKGENYKGLPYLVLDFPRFSSGNKVFIYRTMFWWGNYFLSLLITEGCGYQLKPIEKQGDLKMNIGSSPWNYDLSDSCWITLKNMKHQFIAIGRKTELDSFENIPVISTRTFEEMMSLLIK